ncbi:uncharacterized protein [Rutidosis leptorrhynchoides]|uniref:uncharacterized protein n=1 Tax=Rutidosis leptorrhynchoides TaxID=125765 RepID=UPI003A997F3C
MAPNKYDKIYTVTSVHHLIPVKLDLAKLNYSHWKKLFMTHCAGFDVSDLILLPSTNDEQSDPDWIKANVVVSTWIFNTISPSLLERLLNAEPATAHDAWIFLEKLFLDNKESKTMELNAELRALNMGNLSVEEYFRKIDHLATQIRNLGGKIEDTYLVMFAVNGLPEKYAHVSHIIIRRSPFPSLDIARSMIAMEELTLNRKHRTITESPLNASHPSALVVQANRTASPAKQTPSTTKICRNFLKGFCRFENRCRYLHSGGTGRRSANHTPSSSNRPNSINQAQLLHLIAAQQQQIQAQSAANRTHLQPASVQTPFSGYGSSSLGPINPVNMAQRGLLATPPGFNPLQPNSFGPQHATQSTGTSAHAFYAAQQPLVGSFTVDPNTQSHETILPNAFSTMTLQDYGAAGWNMDTGASTHLTSCINNLSTFFNNCKYPSVSVGDGNTIPVTNTGHSLLSNSYRPLHLNNVLVTPNIVKNLISVHQFTRDNIVSVEFDPFGFSVKDYLTRQLLLRCDSTGDLYPVTPHSPQHALVTSPITWHQRLGHPGHDVLRKLISIKDILCNKTMSPLFCHACQLGKHVRLPFSISSSNVESAFDIIHSDLWTSPVASISCLK